MAAKYNSVRVKSQALETCHRPDILSSSTFQLRDFG